MTTLNGRTDKQHLMADRWLARTGGNFWDYLRETAAGARSMEDATYEIRHRTGIKISVATIRVWAGQLTGGDP